MVTQQMTLVFSIAIEFSFSDKITNVLSMCRGNCTDFLSMLQILQREFDYNVSTNKCVKIPEILWLNYFLWNWENFAR